MAPKYRQFCLNRAHDVSCEGITGKTVFGSVVMIATTQQELPSLRIAEHTLKVAAARGQANAALGCR
jgi:hypothetical protein